MPTGPLRVNGPSIETKTIGGAMSGMMMSGGNETLTDILQGQILEDLLSKLDTTNLSNDDAQTLAGTIKGGGPGGSNS